MISFKHNVNRITLLLALLFVLAASVFYFLTDNNLITSKIWHSNIQIDLTKIEENRSLIELKDVTKIELRGDFKYFNDNTYLQDITLSIYGYSDKLVHSAAITISGKWNYLQGYLSFQTDKIDIIDIGGGDTLSDKVKTLCTEMAIKKLQQTKYIEPINKHTLLMIDIDNSTSIWSAIMDI